MRTPDELVLAFGRWVFCHICVHVHICRWLGCTRILLLHNTCADLYTYILVVKDTHLKDTQGEPCSCGRSAMRTQHEPVLVLANLVFLI
jgi:hypothetical protein